MTDIAKARPTPVTVIALYHFLAAGILLLIALASWLLPDLQIGSKLFVQEMVYVITRHNIVSPAMVPLIMPFIAIYFAVIGWGLWRLKSWSRNFLATTSGLIVLLWIRAILVRGWAMEQNLFRDKLSQNAVYTVILLNATVFCCLTLYPDVARAFGQTDEQVS